jgi:hypothetical protein
MINEEILGGLKSALERGESLKRAMMTFFNAGYKKEEIEEAAKNLTAQNVQPVATEPKIIPTSKPISIPKEVKPVEVLPAEPIKVQLTPQVKTQSPTVKQNVSSYGEEPKDKALIFVLVSVLIFLVGVLLSIFIFKEELINFFSSFFE